MANRKDPKKAFEKGQTLLDEGNPDMAAVYFTKAGEMYESLGDLEMAAKSYEKSAYCFELEDRYIDAKEEYNKVNRCKNRINKDDQLC